MTSTMQQHMNGFSHSSILPRNSHGIEHRDIPYHPSFMPPMMTFIPQKMLPVSDSHSNRPELSYLARITPPMSPVSRMHAIPGIKNALNNGEDDEGDDDGEEEEEDADESSLGDSKSPNEEYVERRFGLRFNSLGDELEKAAFAILELGYETPGRFDDYDEDDEDATEDDDDTVSMSSSSGTPNSRKKKNYESSLRGDGTSIKKSKSQSNGKNCHYSQDVIGRFMNVFSASFFIHIRFHQ